MMSCKGVTSLTWPATLGDSIAFKCSVRKFFDLMVEKV